MSKTSKTSILSATFILLFSLISAAQTQFKKGYFIDNTNTKIECLIKNLDWKNNPDNISYKLTINSPIKSGNIDDIKKFEIYEHSIFVRKNVDVTINTTTSNTLDYGSSFDTEKKVIFLKVLVKGQSNLYRYVEANTRLFYFQIDDEAIKLLEYKEYINDNNKVAKNQTYKSELWNNLKCSSITIDDIKNLDYKENQMIDFIRSYNICNNNLKYVFKDKKRDNVFNLYLRPGINFNKANLDTPGSNLVILRDFDFDNELSFRFGVELEYVLPFNNNKWSLIIEPTYQYYKTDKTLNSTPGSFIERTVTATIDYSSLEIPIGLRHYSYLNNNSRLFFNFSVFFDLSFKSEIEYANALFKSDTGSNLSFGLGYSYKNKYSIEGRLHTKRELLNKYPAVSSEYTNVSVIFGYAIF